ncbi:MAG: acyl carrier protein [Chloroflexota bacterium]|nr:acyl carrier protein [Chloroflexota bacterium]
MSNRTDMISRENVWDATMRLLAQLAEDWDYGEEITGETYLFSDLGFQSLDAVVLGNTLQEKFGRAIPFADLLAEIGQREVNDVTVAEWVDFSFEHLQASTPQEA